MQEQIVCYSTFSHSGSTALQRHYAKRCYSRGSVRGLVCGLPLARIMLLSNKLISTARLLHDSCCRYIQLPSPRGAEHACNARDVYLSRDAEVSWFDSNTFDLPYCLHPLPATKHKLPIPLPAMGRHTTSAFLLAALLGTAAALPKPQFQTYASDPADLPTYTVPAYGPPSATGSLLGPASLNDYNPANPISTDTSVVPTSDFELAEGQTADADIGLYLNFENVENPQPIRGSTNMPTDPGPCK